MSNLTPMQKFEAKWQPFANQEWQYVKNLAQQARSEIKSGIENACNKWMETAGSENKALRIPLDLRMKNFTHVKKQYAELKERFNQCETERDQYQNQCVELASRIDELTQQLAAFSQKQPITAPFEEQKMMQSTGSFQPFRQEAGLSPISASQIIPAQQNPEQTAAQELGKAWYYLLSTNKKFEKMDDDMVKRIGFSLEAHEQMGKTQFDFDVISRLGEVMDHKISKFLQQFVLKEKYFNKFVEAVAEIPKLFSSRNEGRVQLMKYREILLNSSEDFENLIKQESGKLKPSVLERQSTKLQTMFVVPFVESLLQNMRQAVSLEDQRRLPKMKKKTLLDNVMSHMNQCDKKGLENISARFKQHGKLSIAGSFSLNNSGIIEPKDFQFAGSPPGATEVFYNALTSALSEWPEEVQPVVEELKPKVESLQQETVDMRRKMGLKTLISFVKEKTTDFIEPTVLQPFVDYLQEGVDGPSKRDEVLNELQTHFQL